MSNHLDNLPDFVTLFATDAVNPLPDNIDFTWNLPDSFYSNQRSDSCYVSIVDSFQEKLQRDPVAPAQHDQSYLIKMIDGASNYYSTKNKGIVLGGFNLRPSITPATELCYDFAKTGGMLQALISARPRIIRLQITDMDGLLIRPDAPPFRWCITLRFDYVNQQDQIGGMLSTYTDNLLKRN
tara:strand:+ start:3008 stop:3553 length:546 start_codon:yes stop_codon:yes gene_type:complete